MEKLNKSGRKGLVRIYHALLYSLSGLRIAFKNEIAFRQELFAFIILTVIAIILPVSPMLKILLILSIASVMIVELLNSAIETIVDKVSPEYSTAAKHAKDMGSSAVFLTIACATVIWIYVLIKIFILK
jgi:diacylglycerol kinase (ATP)